jgi:hypothetical protein
MILYGTKITGDIVFPLDLPMEGAYRHEVNLSSEIPEGLAEAITCGVYLYRAHGRDVHLYTDRIIEGNKAGQPWCYEVQDVVTFHWVGGERTIYYELGEKGDAHLLSFWFIHLHLPLYMTLEKMYDFLHTGAVEVEGKPILFIAPSMGGKSTMTDYFLSQGQPLITDDKLPIYAENGRFLVAASHPYHRPYRKNEELGYRVTSVMQNFKPIHAIYVLKRSDANASINIQEITGFEKFDTIMPNYLCMFTHLFSSKHCNLGLLLCQVRVFRIFVPWEIGRLNEVYDVVCKHSKGVI